MSAELNRLAEAHGIGLAFVDGLGQARFPGDEAKRALLQAMGVPAATDEDVRRSLKALEAPLCHVPHWLEEGRGWGISCQLYALRSEQNWGIGDFEDLARLAEAIAPLGADFIGINPVHALFFADPTRFSPYSPSSRRFMNPLYIAIDGFDGLTQEDHQSWRTVRETELIDYEAVTRLKRKALEAQFQQFQVQDAGAGSQQHIAFERFRRAYGERLENFALFEALSEAMTAQGASSGWRDWPDAFKDMNSTAVQSFQEECRERIKFHLWLQWLAHDQLAKAQQRALAAGMRIGLYLDLAVGVATDGADTWSEPETVLRGVRIGAPPDAINANGQDWQLAPMSPHALADKQGRLFGALFADAIGPAGAIRIDHAMGLERLYLIADGLDGVDGAYVRYPLDDLLKALGQVSETKQAIIIGEDLGTVPANFRETMCAARILGYRVLFFEREWDQSFRLPQNYQRNALACVSTHDLPTLRGWWEGHDLDDRERLAVDHAETVSAYRAQRETDRKLVIAALSTSNLLPESIAAVARGQQPVPTELPLELAVAITRFLAVTPCRLVAIQLEDLAGVKARANLPGTIHEHPNWRRKLPVDLDELPQLPTFAALVQAVAEERPRCHD